MKQRMILSVLLLCAVGAMATELSLRIVPLTGDAKQTTLSNVGKLVYYADSLFLVDKTGFVSYREALVKVQQVNYTTEGKQPTSLPETENTAAQLLAYPNPTQGMLQVLHAEGDVVRVYDAQGKLLQTANLYDGTATLDVSSYATGTYILLVQNGAFQFIKQ